MHWLMAVVFAFSGFEDDEEMSSDVVIVEDVKDPEDSFWINELEEYSE